MVSCNSIIILVDGNAMADYDSGLRWPSTASWIGSGLEGKVLHGAGFRALLLLWLAFMSYVLSFIYAGVYWNKLQ